MKCHCDPLALSILVDHVTATLPCQREPTLLKNANNFARCHSRQVLSSDRYFDCRQADRHVFRYLFAVCQPIFDVQLDRIFYACNGFLVRSTLAVAALQHWAGHIVSIRVRLDHDGQCAILHSAYYTTHSSVHLNAVLSQSTTE